jgi:hypothetical protein
VIEVIETAVGCLLLTVTVLAALVAETASFPNAKVAGVTVTGTTPFPARETVSGLLFALSMTVSVPVREPVAVGMNVTLAVQLDPPASEVPQVFVCA